jgi:hypothetical protein
MGPPSIFRANQSLDKIEDEDFFYDRMQTVLTEGSLFKGGGQTNPAGLAGHGANLHASCTASPPNRRGGSLSRPPWCQALLATRHTQCLASLIHPLPSNEHLNAAKSETRSLPPIPISTSSETVRCLSTQMVGLTGQLAPTPCAILAHDKSLR